MKAYIVGEPDGFSLRGVSSELTEGVEFCLAGAPVVEIPEGCVLAVIFKDPEGLVIVQEVEL